MVWSFLQPKDLFLQNLVCLRWRTYCVEDQSQPWKAVHDRDFGGPREGDKTWRDTLKQHVRELRSFGNGLSTIEKRFKWAVSKGLYVIVDAVVEEALARKSTKTIFINGYQRNAFLHYSAMRNKFGKTPLFEAVKHGHMEVARALVRHEIVTAYDGLNTMRIAIKKGDEDMVRYLIGEAKLAHVNIETLDTKVAPIHWASRYGKISMLDLLVKNGANVNAVDINNVTPLYIACNYNKEEAVDYLLQKGADPNCISKDGATPLFIACQNGFTEIVSHLLKKGVEVNARDSQGVSPLYVAAQNGHGDIVTMLLEANAAVNASRKDGVSPLHIAAQNGHRHVCQLLMANPHGEKAEVNARDQKLGMTPVFSASETGHGDIVMSLIDQGADIHLAREDGVTPLWVACFKNHPEVVRHLLDKGAQVEVCETNTLLTPLCVAAKAGSWEICSMLIDAGAKVNYTTKSGLSPLFITCAQGHYDVCALLLKNGAQANPKAKGAATPLWIAASKGHHSIVYLLTQHKAKAKVKFNGRSAYDEALKNGHEKVVELLKKL
ncbi:ankyrin 2,3/unc44, putative [Acanthamoeba castellanii str. Neff]|uniref:Ankyrin 2,3/unc44, putative n=2 Tax=Acanthamoeba castellanii (strain ATCC 30010 / Neff) TaxID=1257118 RepID=L8GEA1_ACACF|nr:ankyrin 2,3/unc44, putative [Acanthamoeba castellanii str. Neff]ELR11169.1 ankyrin 2,3/unc44, putative [Acanthamoeba castellanii str. Neff]